MTCTFFLTILVLEGEKVGYAVNSLQLVSPLILGASGFLLTVPSTTKGAQTAMAVAKQSVLHCRFFQEELVPCPAVFLQELLLTQVQVSWVNVLSRPFGLS